MINSRLDGKTQEAIYLEAFLKGIIDVFYEIIMTKLLTIHQELCKGLCINIILYIVFTKT